MDLILAATDLANVEAEMPPIPILRTAFIVLAWIAGALIVIGLAVFHLGRHALDDSTRLRFLGAAALGTVALAIDLMLLFA